MQNLSTILDQSTGGIQLNFERYFASPRNHSSWLSQLQQQDWQQRGIVLWDVNIRIVTHLYAGYDLELLEYLQDNNTWKTNGLVIGSPAFQLSSSSTNSPSTKTGGELVLKNQTELGPNQAQILFEFLSVQKSLLIGSLLDRINIHIEVPRVDYENLSGDRLGESSQLIRKRVQHYDLPITTPISSATRYACRGDTAVLQVAV